MATMIAEASPSALFDWAKGFWELQPLQGIEEPNLVDLGIWTTFWAALYGCLCLLMPKECPDWVIRIHSNLHCAVILLLAGRCIFVVDERHPLSAARLNEANTPLQNLTMVISAGYFLFDLVWCLVYMGKDYTMLGHHVSSAAGLVASLLLGKSGYEAVAVLAGAEITNPFLSVRWFLRHLKAYDTPFACLNDTVFALTFAFVRVMAYHYFITGIDAHLVMKLGGLFLYLLSVVWCVLIFQVYARRYILKTARRRQPQLKAE
ncbi:uncharacterized protein MONBRDRAFT_23965 [Monosiga brevicollis MX1]|uniref:TLC domain-containing protein n=1 Tax=Monosiga brevicollis TaxID=81824 RepID=A9UVC9_MONBE|nr:uncharacterized protein MONBRDRAFT_23965 [Monosiga brevicollis MX1]EDQ91060.1 predicted protein [Monosiga brevicollis MX1]|eukprot:XP_001744357.1 hypothetical protein [Monosiga brevicollis MX1]